MKPFTLTGITDVIKSLGIVFGDIGTSPLYTLNMLVIFVDELTLSNVLGLISLIIWTLIILVFVEYAWLAMSLGHRGEGGTIVLKELLISTLKSRRQIAFVTFISLIGVSLFIGDGIITPAVSILSAVEGIKYIPAFDGIHQIYLVMFAGLIAILLFVFQRRGTERVGSTFGPIMFVWFLTLAITGLFSIVQFPAILHALNPLYGLRFLAQNTLMSFFVVLSGVVLCATGGEALYADMGHLGRRPILRAWYFVFASLVLTYLGQGAFLLRNPLASQVLQQMVLGQNGALYVPFVVLGILATAIASQALISGVFSVVYQGIMTGIMPRLKVDYTSSKLRSQVYIGSVNWALLAAVLFMIFHFGSAEWLTFAYGSAVTGTMALTGVMMTWIFYKRRLPLQMVVSSIITSVDFIFFISTLSKLKYGGYWSFLIALIPFSIIAIYTRGQRRLHQAQRPVPFDEFLMQYHAVASSAAKLKGTALFFVRDLRFVPPYIVQTMFKNSIIYEDNIFVSVVVKDAPFGVSGAFKQSLAPGIRVFEIQQGYMEMLDIEQILKTAGINAQVIFYGMHEFVTRNIVWKTYAVIERLTPSFAQFYKLPPQKLHGVAMLVEM